MAYSSSLRGLRGPAGDSASPTVVLIRRHLLLCRINEPIRCRRRLLTDHQKNLRCVVVPIADGSAWRQNRQRAEASGMDQVPDPAHPQAGGGRAPHVKPTSPRHHLWAHLEVLMLDVPWHSQQIALLVEPVHLVLERQLASSAQVLEGQVCLGNARVQRCFFCSNLFAMHETHACSNANQL